jgi:RecB family exonuclease
MNLQPLDYTTPSLFSALSNCFLQAAFRSDASYITFQPPAMRLGIACHALLERIARGTLLDLSPDVWQDGLERIWQEEIHKQESQLLASIAERHFGQAETWPKYALQKARVFIRANKLLSYQYEHWQGGQGHRRSSSEQSYHSYNGLLRGRADMVYESSLGVELVDYKTGNIFDHDEIGNVAIRESYKQQLHLYAAMHHDCTGVWPVRGHLVPLTGEPVTIDIDPAVAEKLAQSALQQMAEFNECVSKATRRAELATPSISACHYCSYKAHCSAFWKFSFELGVWGSAAHLEAVVCELNHQENKRRASFLLQVVAGTLPAGEYTCYASRPEILMEGQRVRLINAWVNSQFEPQILKIHDYTVIYNLSSETTLQSSDDNTLLVENRC